MTDSVWRQSARLLRFGVAVLASAFSMIGRAASFSDVSTALFESRACNTLMARMSYGYPWYTLIAGDPRTFGENLPLFGYRMDSALPQNIQSIELQSYPDGGKLMILPVWNEASGNGAIGSPDAFQVYAVSKARIKLKKYYSNGTVIPDPTAEPSADKLRIYYSGAVRKMENYWAFASWRSAGQQTPYIETVYTYGGLLSSGYYTDSYVYEQCDPIATVTPDIYRSTVAPALVSAGYGDKCSAPNDFRTDFSPPDCIATYFLHKRRSQDIWQSFKREASFVPVLGTGLKVRDCVQSGDPWCWGDAAVSGITDAAAVVIPVVKTGATFARATATASKLAAAQRPVLGLAAVGQAGMSLKDWSDGNKVQALARLVGAGVMVWQVSYLSKVDPVTGQELRATTVRQLPDTPVETPSCVAPEPPLTPPVVGTPAASLPQVELSSLDLSTKIGEGSSSIGYAVGEDVAVVLKESTRAARAEGLRHQLEYMDQVNKSGVTYKGHTIAPELKKIVVDEAGETAGYIAERLPGKSFNGMVDDGITLDDMNAIFGEVENQLKSLWEKGLVHGDAVGDNMVIVRNPDNTFSVRLIDFRPLTPVYDVAKEQAKWRSYKAWVQACQSD